MTESVFVCPLCRARLQSDGKTYCCLGEKRHCYDISASGYVNLLPPGRKSNAKTGDDAGMISARRRFLAKGHYDKISIAAAKTAAKYIDIKAFADAGCGEGHHTNIISKALNGAFGVGIDASKKGADAAAKAARLESANTVFAAANIFDMPLLDGRFDAVFSLFAPVPDREAARILKKDGILLVCSSGSRHLWQMREVLYGEPRQSDPLSRIPEGFEKAGEDSLSFEITVSGDEIEALFSMTPFYYRSPPEGKQRLLSLDTLHTEISVVYNVYSVKKQ